MEFAHYHLVLLGTLSRYLVLDHMLLLNVTDFKTLGYCNHALKYTDNFSLLVPENSDVSATDEVEHIISWFNRNKLKSNLSKCRELVFKRPNLKHEISPRT